ncbi:MAG TPA: hypothetical protein DDZ51_05180, partial [Planctomycetaceae bacterium]|nr:hypothetical protein [Planctomycetaceae bacterium]
MKCSLLLLVAIALNTLASLPATEPSVDDVKRILAEMEPRIRSIYDRREFRPNEFSAKWLPDSSGYLIQQLDPRTNQQV